jgi:hypothetical protein
VDHTFTLLSRLPVMMWAPSGVHDSAITSPWLSHVPNRAHVMPESSARRARQSMASVDASHTLMDASRPADAMRWVAGEKRTVSTGALWPVIVSSSRQARGLDVSHTFRLVSLLHGQVGGGEGQGACDGVE